MMNCKKIALLVSTDAYKNLGLKDRLELRLHLFMCGMCRQYKQQQQFIKRALRGLNDLDHEQKNQQLSTDAKAKIQQDFLRDIADSKR